MLIKIINKWKLAIGVLAYPHEIGLMFIDNTYRNTYRVIDKQLFFVSIMKHGIEYKSLYEEI